MRILFLNQYFPPDPAPTGILFAEIAEECRRKGHEVEFVDAKQEYRGGQQKGGRMKRELAALLRMTRTGKARPCPDVVVSGSSPPCLPVFAARVAHTHRAAHVHWAMDVYPEIAVALGEIRGGSLVHRMTGWLMGRAYRQCASVVALDDDMAGVLARYRARTTCIRPWVFQQMLAQIPGDAHRITKQGQGFIWLYSGNLGRAHDYETILAAQRILEDQQVEANLIFQGGGPAWPAAKSRAEELKLQRCEWRDYTPEESVVGSLLESDALVVTQRPETQGLLWPSKLGLVTALQRPILFVGPPNGAIARELGRLSGIGVHAPSDAQGVADWVRQQRETRQGFLRIDPVGHRHTALDQWVHLLETAAKR